MKLLTSLRSLASAVLGKARIENETEEELRAHVERRADDLERSGLKRPEAERRARIEFGGHEKFKEECREARGGFWLETVASDIRYGLRILGKSPGFTTLALLTLTLGMGVNTTLFTAFDSVALKPLPVDDPGSLVRFKRWFSSGALGSVQDVFSYPEYLNYREQNHAFSGVIAVSWPTQVLANMPAESVPEPGAPREPQPLECQLVSRNYFSVLGTNAMVGRVFGAEENQVPGANPVIVLSHPFWQRQFNSDGQISGRTLEVNGTAFTILGVTSPDFIGTGNPPRVPDFWAPLAMQSQLMPGHDWLNEPTNRALQVLGRLAPGTSLGQAQAEAGVLTRQFGRAHAAPDETIALTLRQATYFGETDELWFRAFVAGLMAVVGLVLLVACVNLANMLLARAANRQKEIGTRLALGASRGRLIRQLLTESVLLALLGGLAGFLFSLWATKLAWLGLVRLMQALLGSRILVAPLTPDARVFLYTFGLSLTTGVLFGLWPALESSKGDLTQALKAEGSPSGQPPARSRFRNLLVGGQVAVSIVLLISSGLLLRAMLRSQAVSPGFETRRVFLLSLDLGSDKAKAATIKRQIIDRLRTLPEIASVALAYRLPYLGTMTFALQVEGSQASPRSLPGQTLANYVSPSYFPTLGIPIVRGRGFTPQEAEELLPAVIVSESTARRGWPGEDPLGKHLKLARLFRWTKSDWKEYEVIGVAKDVRFFSLSRIDRTQVYLPTNPSEPASMLIRVSRSPRDTLASVRASLGEFDKSLLPKLGLVSLAEFKDTQELLPRAAAIFAAILAFLALTLAAVGIYGVMACLVTQRTREVGIRLAFGASKNDVLWLLVRQGMLPVSVGAACGLVVSIAFSGVLRAILIFPGSYDLLFGVSAFDPATYLGLTAFLATIALLACSVPARRATRVDPMVALRYE
ncbi:MAG TPA: ABC transporter permease [Candidatus Acidoferrum sp.]